MNRYRSRNISRGGFTLIELMTATALTLIVMSILASVFVSVTNSITNSRATIEMNQRLTAVASRLQKDMQGYTVNPDPLRDDFTDGYISIVEGPIRTGALQGAGNQYAPQLGTSQRLYWQIQEPPNLPDTTLGDRDDIFAATIRSVNEPFVGRYGIDPVTNSPGTYSSEVAEVIWFLRGTTLYRRVLLVGNPMLQGGNVPIAAWSAGGDRYVRGNGGIVQSGTDSWPGGSFYNFADTSVYRDAITGRFVPNTLSDLSLNERRFPHPIYQRNPDPRTWGVLGMPTHAENAGINISNNVPGWGAWDRRLARHAFTNVNSIDQQTGWTNNGIRAGEDVVLTDVIGFDVKVWDPGAPIFLDGSGEIVMPGDPQYPGTPNANNAVGYGAFVDLGYAPGYDPTNAPVRSQFYYQGVPNSPLVATGLSPCVYDTWTDYYERDGNGPDTGLNGYDDNNNGGVDEFTEWETPPPYPYPLRGVRITIRVIDPDTDQIREVSVTQDFVFE